MKRDIHFCSCGLASVEFHINTEMMDSWWASLENCHSDGSEMELWYICDHCDEAFKSADPSMIAFEKEAV